MTGGVLKSSSLLSSRYSSTISIILLLDTDTKHRIVAEIEAEQALVNANRELGAIS